MQRFWLFMQVVHIVTTLWWVAGFFLAVYTKIADVVEKVCSVFSPAAPATTVRCSRHVTSASRCVYRNVMLVWVQTVRCWRLILSKTGNYRQFSVEVSSTRLRKSPGCSSRFVTCERLDRQTLWVQLIGALLYWPTTVSLCRLSSPHLLNIKCKLVVTSEQADVKAEVMPAVDVAQNRIGLHGEGSGLVPFA